MWRGSTTVRFGRARDARRPKRRTRAEPSRASEPKRWRRQRRVAEDDVRIVDGAEPLIGHALGVVAGNASPGNARQATLVHLAGREGRILDHDAREALVAQADRRLRDADVRL